MLNSGQNTNEGLTVMASPPVIEDPSHASRRAKVRIGIAAALLATAVGILAVLNQRQTEPAEEPDAPVAAQESLSSAEAEPAQAPLEMPPPEETTAPVPTTPQTASPEVPAVPPPPPVPGQLPPAPAGKPQPTLASEQEGSGGVVAPAGPRPAKSVAQPAAKEPPARTPPAETPPQPASKAAEPKAFEVQLGVFTDMENAKQLQSKLAEHGIPSHTETRVQIGPFKSRAEADQARAKLKALGISSVIIGK